MRFADASQQLLESYSLVSVAPWQDQIAALGLLRSVLRQLADLDSVVERQALKALPSQRVVLPGLVAERISSTRLGGWDHEEISGRLTDLLLFDKTTGAAGDLQTAQRVRGGFLFAARIEWRTTALRSLGVRYGDCVTRAAQRPRLKIHEC